jgi:adenylate cyclase
MSRNFPLRWLIPRPDESGKDLSRRIRVVLTLSIIFANVVGALIVVALGILVLPFSTGETSEATVRLVNGVAAAIVLCVFSFIGSWWGLRRLRTASKWLKEERKPNEEEQRIVLGGPRRIVWVTVVMWSVAAVGFGLLNATFSLETGMRVATMIVFAGASTCAFVYFIAERQLRPAAARALAARPVERRLSPGIKTRTLLAWAMGSAVPLLGLVVLGISRLGGEDFTGTELALMMVVLGVTGLVVGAYLLFLAARAISDPVVELRRGVERVQEGDLETEVAVYDASEVGQLQVGFNRMLDGLRERDRLEDLFGRHVGEEVAREALDQEIELGGETREVAILFVDVIGSTAVAAERDPQEVVELLNEFFKVVVDTVHDHDGWVNKFEGDAALAVFGAPVPVDGAETKALCAARKLAQRLDSEVELDAGIGVSAGTVVAGNIGDERRFEYTVIGDPVNEAARLTELAKDEDGRVLASSAILEKADESERKCWSVDREVELRGRKKKTEVAKLAAA